MPTQRRPPRHVDVMTMPVNGLNGNGDGPTWIKAARAIAYLGAPTVISLGLVYWLTSRIDRELERQHQEHTSIVERLQDNQQLYIREAARMRELAYRICVNGAVTAHELAVCNYQEEPSSKPRVPLPTDRPTPRER